MEEPGLASANPVIIRITEYNEIRSPVGILSICGELGSTLVNKAATKYSAAKNAASKRRIWVFNPGADKENKA
jgi:hypothetical protein